MPSQKTRISLTRNLGQTLAQSEFQFQVAELLSRLEDYLNGKVEVFLIDSKTKNLPRPTFNYGDVVFDLTIEPGIATLQQWDGTKLVPLSLSSIIGDLDLVLRGIGSGNDSSKFLASKGDGRWELRTPEVVEFVAVESIPAFSLATAQGNLADSSNQAHRNRVIGMTKVSVAAGFVGEAMVDDMVTNPAWTWTIGDRLFLNGTTLSTTPPATGFSQMVAVAKTSQTIIMKISQAVFL